MRSVHPFAWRRRVAMRDVDAWGVVWHGNYFAFCDEARSELLRAFDLAPGDFVTRGFVAPVIDAKARFLAPARLDDEIEVRVKVRLGRGTRMHFDFAVSRPEDGKLLAELSTTQVLVRTSGELVYLVPPEIKRSLDRMVAAQARLDGVREA